MPPPTLTENTDDNSDETRQAAIKRTEEGWEPEKSHLHACKYEISVIVA